MAGDRVALLCRALLPQAEAIEARGAPCVVLARLPAEPERPAMGFVLAGDVEVPPEAYTNCPGLRTHIRRGLAAYRAGGDLPVVVHVVGPASRVELVRFARAPARA